MLLPRGSLSERPPSLTWPRQDPQRTGGHRKGGAPRPPPPSPPGNPAAPTQLCGERGSAVAAELGEPRGMHAPGRDGTGRDGLPRGCGGRPSQAGVERAPQSGRAPPSHPVQTRSPGASPSPPAPQPPAAPPRPSFPRALGGGRCHPLRGDTHRRGDAPSDAGRRKDGGGGGRTPPGRGAAGPRGSSPPPLLGQQLPLAAGAPPRAPPPPPGSARRPAPTWHPPHRVPPGLGPGSPAVRRGVARGPGSAAACRPAAAAGGCRRSRSAGSSPRCPPRCRGRVAGRRPCPGGERAGGAGRGGRRQEGRGAGGPSLSPAAPAGTAPGPRSRRRSGAAPAPRSHSPYGNRAGPGVGLRLLHRPWRGCLRAPAAICGRGPRRCPISDSLLVPDSGCSLLRCTSLAAPAGALSPFVCVFLGH
ncbi:thyroxine 5-deiodinase isoform X1 [Chroicocephalus ridibundus]|uniref:thyroxine 5-deiodinase isoform X1 n=1 Tax=Chroicocephalus ridibundus TaxID=1192867 RepID=UPI002FDE4A3E